MLRMQTKLTQAIEQMTELDEKLMTSHGIGILDGYTHEFLVWKCSVGGIDPN